VNKRPDSSSPRLRLGLALSPTMIEDRMGTIGSTQGVNARPRPSSRNSGTIFSNWPPCSVCASGAAASSVTPESIGE